MYSYKWSENEISALHIKVYLGIRLLHTVMYTTNNNLIISFMQYSVNCNVCLCNSSVYLHT
jgi:hypothetical protein